MPRYRVSTWNGARKHTKNQQHQSQFANIHGHTPSTVISEGGAVHEGSKALVCKHAHAVAARGRRGTLLVEVGEGKVRRQRVDLKGV